MNKRCIKTKSGRKRCLRILAALLALCVSVTSCPDMMGAVPARAAEAASGGTRAGEASDSGQSEYMKYANNENGSGFTRGLNVFNIQGMDNSNVIQTTFMNQGYRTVSKAGEATITWNAPRDVAMGSSLFGSRDIALVHNGRYARIRYTVQNKGSTEQHFQVGSSADVMIGGNDCAPVVGTANGLKMEGAPKNSYTYNLVAPTADTLWYGNYNAAPDHIFDDLADKTKTYDGDSGMAWSWSGTVAPGQTWSRYVLLGVGELPPAPNKPVLTVTNPTLIVGKTGNVTGTADPGCTVCVEIAGEEFSAVADKSGRFSVPVTLSENTPAGEMPLTCYAVSPEGGISETVKVTATVIKEPFITLTDTETVILADSEVNDAWYRGFIKASSGTVSYTESVKSTVVGTYTVTYTAKATGFPDKTAKLRVIVLPKALELSVATATRVSGKDSFSLSAKLLDTGGVDITETGFVWGIMKNPTVTINNGQKKTASPVKSKNGSLTATAEQIADGMDYYARAYAKNAAGEVWYGEQARFSINGKQYGSFTINNNGNNTFTVTRNGGTDGRQKVYYRTVNGSAVCGTHFGSKSSYLTFAEGETKKTITVSETGVNAAFSGKPATAYTNADRVYWMELYRVEGGGQLGAAVKAQRTMAKTSGYTVSRDVYNEKSRSVSTSNDNCIVADRSKTKDHQTYFRNNRGYNQTHGQNNFNAKRSLDVGTDKERTYLKATAGGYYYRLRFKGKEDDDGYEHIWIADHAPNNMDSANEHNGLININDNLFGAAKYTARWEINNGKEADITVPGTASRTNTFGWSNSARDGAVSGDWLQFGVNDEANVWFSATGKSTDKWRVNSYTDWLKVRDETEPQLISVGPVGGTYKPGDAVTLPLVFDEIVDSRNSSLSGVTLDTTWGSFKYAGGADTNVLYFTGTVPQGASGTLKVSKINGANGIKDMCGTNGKSSGGTGSTTVTVDTKSPTVSITGPSLANGTAQATITASNADSLRYAWTQSASMPVAGWLTCTSGTKVTNRQTSGTWYLHALATYDATGVTAYDSRSFNFSSSVSGELPELNVSVDNSAWARERKINITTKKPANASVTVRTPSGTVQTVTGTSYTATANGSYTFTLTAGEEKIVKSVTVAKLDRMVPAAQVTEPAGMTQTENVTFTVTPSDAGGSGVKNVTGTWTKTTDGGSAVTENATLTKQSDGTYKAMTPGSDGSTYTYRLNLTVTDNAGNTASAASGTCTVNLRVPTVTVTKTGSTSKGDTYSYTVNANGNTITAVNLPDSGNTTALSGSFTLTVPGTYYVTVSDQAGHVVISAPMTVAENVDGDAPEVRAYQRDTDWVKTSKIELSIYEKGGIQEIKLESGGATTNLPLTGGRLEKENGSSSAYRYSDIGITANGTYTFTVTDTNGNKGTAQITVENIDKTAPVLTAEADAAPKAGGWYTDTTVPVVMTFHDPTPANGEGGSKMSGIASVQYKLVSKAEKDKGAEPSGLNSVSVSDIAKGTYTVSLTQMGTTYLYVKVTDKAGNEYKGYCNATGTADTLEIKKDQSKGSLVSLTGPKTAQKETDGLGMTVKVNYGPSGAELTVTGQTAPVRVLPPHDGTSTKQETINYTTKTTGVNRIYIKPVSWGSKYSWSYYVRRVTFDSQGGSAVPSLLVWTRQNSTSAGTTLDCKVEKPADPTRKGYTFGGWYTDAACTDGKEFDFSDSQKQVRTDTTLYARWTQDVYKVEYDLKMPEYEIHFSKNMENTDCTKSSSKMAHRHYQCEKPYEAPANKTEYRYGDNMKLPVPTLEPAKGTFEYKENGETKVETHSYAMTGFTFDGWYDNAQYTGRKYTSIEADATGNKKFYARWQDTQAPSVGSVWRYGTSGYGSWYSTSAIGLSFTDNAEIDMASMKVQIDGGAYDKDGNWVEGAWMDPYTSGTPDYSHGSYWVAYVREGSKGLSEGRHTYRVKMADKSGNETVSPEQVFYNDRTSPTGTMTYSVEPTELYIKDNTKVAKGTEGSTKTLFFNQAPTIRISAEDNPAAGSDIYSGLYKMEYTLTERDMATGTQKPETEEPRYKNPQTKTVYFTGYSTQNIKSGTVEFSLPENWRGKVTNIRVYDRAGNYYTIPAIGEVVVDTVPPVIKNTTQRGQIYFGSSSSGFIARLEDRWYTQEELDSLGITQLRANILAYGQDASGNPIASTALEDGAWKVNGKRVTIQGGVSWNKSGMGVMALSNAKLTGVNDITLEMTDYAGNTVTAGITLKIRGGKEKTPEATLDYPADALSQVVKNADYAVTVEGTTYTVNSGAAGRIPFVLTHDLADGIATGDEVDLCGKEITIMKKGITENGEKCTDDSDTQTLSVNERPSALDASGITFEPELLKDADDAQVNLVIDADDTYSYEYSADAGRNWKEVPSDGMIQNVPAVTVLLRAKAKANTTGKNDGWPHGRQSGKDITSNAGKVITQFDLNDEGTNTATGQPGSQEGSYKSVLTRPAVPIRSGYEFMGWYTEAERYQPGGTTDKKWRFSGETGANTVGEILGTDKDAYKDRIQADGSIRVTLYAGWRETTAPELSVALETDTSTDGSGTWVDVTGQTRYYPNLRVKLTYSDNVGVTKLYYKPYKTSTGSYSEMYMGEAREDGTSPSDRNQKQYTLTHTPLNTGERTYTFKAVDAAGNETVKEITFKLDKTVPVLGEESFSSGSKNIWHWMIGKDMKITIPVTETGGSLLKKVEYTLIPFTSDAADRELTEDVSDAFLDTGNAVTKNASLSGSTSKGYTATITLPSDFKGVITVKAEDNAGNCPEVKKIGVPLTGVMGLFVEKNAPVIDVKADRTTGKSDGDAEECKTSYSDAVTIPATGYYNTAPKLFIHVEDQTNGIEKNAGIASLTWKIDRTPRGGTKETGVTNTVKADFDAAPTRDYELALNELAGKIGVFDVTVIATDQAGNQTTKTVKVNVKSKAETPEFEINYAEEKLTGLVPDAEYDVRGETITADGNGCIRIAEEWFGTNFQISRRAYSDELLDSDCAETEIAVRPDAPEIRVEEDETIRGKNDARISGVAASMEYSADGGRTWNDVKADELEDLTGGTGTFNVPAGLIQVRVKATGNAPHGQVTEVTPKEGRTLTVTFNPMGGSNVPEMTNQSWHNTLERPDDPARAGHDFVGWYKEAACENEWHFEGEAGTADKLTGDITLYAKWRDIEKPALSAVLKTDGTEDAESGQWYPDLSIDLTYADNTGVTKLWVRKDGGDYTLFGSMDGADGSTDISDSDPQGETADGYMQYHFTYRDVAEGSHTYTFKAEDADGNTTETQTLTAMLDKTSPVLGEASFDSGHKALWNWIVRNDILLVTVPITEKGSGVEEVAFTLIPADADGDAAAMTGAAKAEKVTDGSADYRAVIAVASDFKGTIRIEAQDKAGNKAAARTIGTTGESIEGVIVEDNAPVITVHADRDITGAAMAKSSDMTISEEYYETAPELTVNVTDEENDSLSGLITGGIASLSYRIGEGGQTEVRSQEEYKTALRTTDHFTIPADKIPAGVTDIIITAADHAGNVTRKELTIKVKTPLDKPQAKIDYAEEILTGLLKDVPYRVSVEGEDDGSRMRTDADGKIKIEKSWLGRSLTIAQISSEEARSDSPAQSIIIPTRPAAPKLSTVEESHPLWRDGKITGLTAGTAYEISEDGGIIWQWRDAVVTGTEITGLSGAGSAVGDASGSYGTYHVRVKAVDHGDGTGSFASEGAVVTVQSGPVEKFPTPDAEIDYRETTLTGLEANAEYILMYEQDGETVTGIGTTDEEGNMIIEEDWMGGDCQIIRSGYGVPGADSDPQNKFIPARPATPVPAGKEVSLGKEDGKLTGLTAGAVYEISTDDGETWTEKTADEGGEITGLGAAKYIVRVPATDTSFASLPSATVRVYGHYAVTLHGNGGSPGTVLTDYIEGTGAVLPANWTKTGYTFAGWYDNADCSGAAVTRISGTDTGDKEYWAKWKQKTGGKTPTPTRKPTPATAGEKKKPSDKEKRETELYSGLKAVQTGTKLQISWGRVKGADGYKVYVQYCNNDFSSRSLNQVKSGKKTTFTVKKINGKKLNTKKNFKLYVVAYQKKKGKTITLARTITVHIAGKDSVKYTNVRKIKIKKASYTLKKGSAVTLRPKAVRKDKHKKQLSVAHTREFRYRSSNKKIAVVTAGGKVKAKGAGSCTVYIFAKNGCKRKIKIKVK
jgi:Listeria/Bacterioides repeat/Listeria/Bacterioides repeat/Listeria/Bacterioides repeat